MYVDYVCACYPLRPEDGIVSPSKTKTGYKSLWVLRTEPRSLLQEHQVVLIGNSSFQLQGLIENSLTIII